MGVLDGSYVKLDRARAHANDLKRRIDPLLKPVSDSIVRDHEGDPPQYVYRVQRLPVMDPEWSAILGDFLTNMRASLDYLAHDLVKLSGGKPGRHSKFPIVGLPKDDTPRNPVRITGVTDEAILDVVESVQPDRDQYFSAGHVANPLYLLNELVNTDKHRLLILVVFALDPMGVALPVEDRANVPHFRISVEPLKIGDPVAWVDTGGRPLDRKFDPRLAFDVRLDETTSGYRILRSVFDVMGMIHYWIESMVIAERFAPILGVERRYSGPLFD